LRDELSVSDPVLSKHIKQLEMVGYLNLRKSTPDALPTTDVYALTGDCIGASVNRRIAFRHPLLKVL